MLHKWIICSSDHMFFCLVTFRQQQTTFFARSSCVLVEMLIDKCDVSRRWCSSFDNLSSTKFSTQLRSQSDEEEMRAKFASIIEKGQRPRIENNLNRLLMHLIITCFSRNLWFFSWTHSNVKKTENYPEYKDKLLSIRKSFAGLPSTTSLLLVSLVYS